MYQRSRDGDALPLPPPRAALDGDEADPPTQRPPATVRARRLMSRFARPRANAGTNTFSNADNWGSRWCS